MFSYEKYLRMSKLPHIWCSGCGNGTVLKAALRAIDQMGWDKNSVMAVSGIGCSSRATGYLDFNTLHTLHGRALPFATGTKMANPDLNVVVFTGDGDATAIGGNHFIHAARRNLDMTVVLFNNNIYGMTGGQYSPTTLFGYKATTAPYGNIDPSFDIVNLAIGAGATFVARTSIANPREIEKFIYEGMLNKGFSIIEVVANCHVQFGKRNKMKTAFEMHEWIKSRVVNRTQAEKMSPEELEGKLITGIFKKETKPEYVSTYDALIVQKCKEDGHAL